MDKSPLPLLRLLVLAWLTAVSALAHAQVAPDQLTGLAQRHAMAQLALAGTARAEVVPGRLDARLRLSPCEEVQPYLPQGARLWGATRVGLRCVKGVTNWNVYLPITVNVYGPALVSRTALPAGHVLSANDLTQAEVNLAEDKLHAPLAEASALVGRALARPLAAGQALREPMLKARQWFTAGEKVRIRVSGQGYAVASAGEAITAGIEGQPARVRTEGGRVISGMPVGERLLEIAL